jgi:GxxExxY protein
MAEVLHSEVTFAIIGAAMELHRELGPGFLESVYQRGLEAELRRRKVPFEAQKRILIDYKGESLGEHVLDLVVDTNVVVELKAVKDLTDQHEAQIISYLKASGLAVGLLINFSKPSLEHKRILLKEAFR